MRGEHRVALSFAEEALSIGRELAEPLLEWNGLFYLGVASYSRGDLTAAWTYLQQAATCAHAVSAAVPEASCFHVMGMILCDKADYASVEPIAEHAYRLGRIDPWLSGMAARAPLPSAPARASSPLAAREQEVAALLARGLSNRQIADELVISLHTAQRHVENILSKLAFSSRTQVAAWAINEGLTADLRRP
jgi:DNA-binding CsgD family transcriptional regulator